MKSMLKEKYNKEAVPDLKEKFGVSNVMAVPKILKVTLNAGTGKYLKEKKVTALFLPEYFYSYPSEGITPYLVEYSGENIHLQRIQKR